MPAISVIIPSYNHEKFVGECIQSVLDQSFQDFEIIVTDDASTDRTVETIQGFKDSRIKLFRHAVNQGVSVTANDCIRHASGKYIAWLSSDDVWYPQKLALQVKYMDEHSDIAAVFGKVEWIDQDGLPIRNKSFPFLNVFEEENRSRFKWMNYFFFKGNCLSLPTSMIRTQCFDKVGLFDQAFANIQDLDLWIRICLGSDIHVMDKKLIKNRWIGDEINASGDSISTRLRVRIEYKHSLDHYLKIKHPELLLSIFPNASRYGVPSIDTIPYFLGRIAIDEGLDFRMVWGLDVIYGLMKDMKSAKILADNYGFTYVDFIKLAGRCDTFRIIPDPAQSQVQEGRYRRFIKASKQYFTEIFRLFLHLVGRV